MTSHIHKYRYIERMSNKSLELVTRLRYCDDDALFDFLHKICFKYLE